MQKDPDGTGTSFTKQFKVISNITVRWNHHTFDGKSIITPVSKVCSTVTFQDDQKYMWTSNIFIHISYRTLSFLHKNTFHCIVKFEMSSGQGTLQKMVTLHINRLNARDLFLAWDLRKYTCLIFFFPLFQHSFKNMIFPYKGIYVGENFKGPIFRHCFLHFHISANTLCCEWEGFLLLPSPNAEMKCAYQTSTGSLISRAKEGEEPNQAPWQF